jgi:SAM-dependent methyltransferase
VPRRRLETNDLRAAWERNAADWIHWARDPADLDGHYVCYHRDLFLELLPPPPARTLDLGSGEGRLGRDLADRGYDIVAVDASPSMVAAAREASPGMEIHQADAASLPLPDASFDLVVAFMSLQDADDLGSAVREVGRVLSPGGHICLAIVHPVNSAGEFSAREPDAPFVISGSYPDESYYVDEIERGDARLLLESVHRPIQTYTDALAEAGLLIERVREIPSPEHADTKPSSPRWRRIPLFLHIRAVKARLERRDRLDLDEGAGRELRDLDGRPRGRLLADVLRVDAVHRLEVAEVLEEDGRLHEPVETAAGFLQDGSQVREDLLGLLRDPARDLGVARLQAELPGDEDEAARRDRLRVRGALERRRCGLGADDALVAHSRGRSLSHA